MSADLIGDDACREAFNKARQQRFSVHGLDVVCEPDIFRAGYAAGRDSEIAKRDARMAELEKELQAGATAVENCDLFRAELAAIKAQEPAFMWHKGATEDESEVVDVDCACPCCVPLYAAPVSEAKAQGVVMPERWNVPRPMWKDARQPYGNPLNHADIEAAEKFNLALDEVARLNAAPAAPAADAGIVDMYRHLQKVTPYRFKKIQDASITDGGDVMYFHKDRFDAAVLADMATHCAAKGVV